MKILFVMPITFCFLFSTNTLASRPSKINSVCESFSAGKIDAFQTLEALDLNIDDYSIGVNNTARIVCA